ncbi:MAG: hypothetical protein HXX13_03365 [Bacteroidetes bacterium]|nr:hypothetical protein [Bacteroidota bacterium]
MRTRELFISLVFSFGVILTYGQVKLETQLGGSNYLGMTLNAAYDLPLSKDSNQLITPTLGIGVAAPFWYERTCILHAGLNYSYKRIGIGSELSWFTGNPIYSGQDYQPEKLMVIYPNINIAIVKKRHWYFRLSGGAYFAFSKEYNYENEKHSLRFEGDVIPGLGITLGYKFSH